MRAHWTKEVEMVRYAHESVMEALSKMKWSPYKAKVDIRIVAYLKRPMDSDNVCDKLLIDAIKHYGVILEDDPRYVYDATTHAEKAKKDYTEIYIEKCT